jgi:hypothetical protein
MIGFDPGLVLAILAKIHGPHSMGCAFQSNSWINANMILQCLVFAYGFIKIMRCKMFVDE